MEGIKKSSTSTTSTTTPSSLLARNAVTRLAVEIFDGTGGFGMWQGEVSDALFQQGLDIVLEKLKPDEDLVLMSLGSLLEEFEFLEMALLHGRMMYLFVKFVELATVTN
ncbi:hypothetical protein Salat_2541500 [Sesamum alatum]|uniref:Uncharacterized protein n=1 Tax=Sesamum alatum TaxID=300844 RepID=A0AAE1XS95_9LAMI|nr:hypothetical protein Salat_2541500 [Sesamum alatum]